MQASVQLLALLGWPALVGALAPVMGIASGMPIMLGGDRI